MSMARNVSLSTALRYKGREPFWAFLLHRIGGLGMAIFVTMHVLASFLSGGIGQFLNNIYEHWLFQIVVFFCALFHVINGLRISILDLWPNLIEYQREAIWIEWAVFLPIFILSLVVIIQTAGG